MRKRHNGAAVNIYVGNLSLEVTENDLRKVFEGLGWVTAVFVIKEEFSRHSRCFAVLKMPNKAEGQAAIMALNGKQLMGRMISVREARSHF